MKFVIIVRSIYQESSINHIEFSHLWSQLISYLGGLYKSYLVEHFPGISLDIFGGMGFF